MLSAVRRRRAPPDRSAWPPPPWVWPALRDRCDCHPGPFGPRHGRRPGRCLLSRDRAGQLGLIHQPKARKVPPCLAFSTASATSPVATRGASSPPGSSSPSTAFMLNSSVGGSSRRELQPARVPSRSARPTPSRTASRRRRSTPPTSSSTPRTASPPPAAKAAVEQAVDAARRGHARDRREQIPTTRADPPSARTAPPPSPPSAFDTEKIGRRGFDAAEKAVQGAPRRRHPGRVRRRPRLRRRRRRAGDSEMIGILMAVVVLAIAFGSLVAMSLPIVVGPDRPSLVGSSAIGIMSGFVAGPEDHQHRRDDARPRCRHRLRAVHPGPAPSEPGRRACPCPRPSAAPTPPPGCRCCSPASPSIVAIAGLQVSGIPMMTMMGCGSAIMVAVAMLASITLLPALLGVVRHAGQQPPGARSSSRSRPTTRDVEVGTLGGQGRRPAGPLRRRGRRHPRRSSPSRCSRCGSASPTPATTPPDSTTRKAYDLMADGYGPGVNGPLAGRASRPTARRTPPPSLDDVDRRPRRRARASPRSTRRSTQPRPATWRSSPSRRPPPRRTRATAALLAPAAHGRHPRRRRRHRRRGRRSPARPP